MDEHPIQELMTTAMESLKEMIDVNTIIGDPVECTDGTIIIPVSKVGFGFAAGGSEFQSQGNSSDENDSETLPFGGGSGGGGSVTPVAFLIVQPSGIKMVHLDDSTHFYEKIIELAPQAVEKITKILKDSNQKKDNTKEKSSLKNTNYEI